MNEQYIRELESAAAYITAPSVAITEEQRRSIENVFLNFRKSKTPYVLCRQILETSQVHYVLFEAAEALKSALIREWSFLQESDLHSLRQYLMQYVFMRNDLPFFVQERILQVIAIMIKRDSVEDFGQERSSILSEIENLIVNGDHAKKILGCNLIYNLMQEYSNTVKSTDVGLPWEVHLKAKKQFELCDLKRIFKFCVQFLSQIIKNNPPYDNNMLQLIKNLLIIAAGVLTWGFISLMLPKRLIAVYESVYEADQAPALRLTNSWSEIMFAPQFLPLMCEIYCKVRDYEELLHHVLTCFMQLASLSGGLMNSSESVKHQYINSYMENFLKLLGLIQLNFKNKEALGISNIIRKLQIFFGREIFQLTMSVQESYLNHLTNITCCFAEGAKLEEAQLLEDNFYMEAFDNMLEAWTNIFQGNDANEDILKESATRIFNIYLKCHLAPPDGARIRDEESDVIEDNEDNDRIKFKEQLQVIGICGRIMPSYTLPLLYRLLEERSNKLKLHLQTMRSQTMTLSDSSRLDDLFEDIHWLILIAGHILCMDSEGETPIIPSEIMQYSIEQFKKSETTVNSTLSVLADVAQVSFEMDNAHCDHAIRIFADVLKLCALESSAAEVKLGHFMSPEVGCTLMWFLKRWCLSYLFPTENFYEEISNTIISALGKDTDGATFTTNFILKKIQGNICHFNSEPILLQDTVNLFTDIVAIKQKSMYIVKTEGLWNLINFQNKLKTDVLSSSIRRCLYTGFVLCGAALVNQNSLIEYYQQILKPIHLRFKDLVGSETFTRIYQQEHVKSEMIDIIECFIGATKGSQISTASMIFDYIKPILSELPFILKLYKNDQIIVQLVLELFGQCARNMLCYLGQSDSHEVYKSSLGAIQMYSKYNVNRLSMEIFAEESSFQDLLLVLKLLTHILSKDCVDFGSEFENDSVTITAVDVVLFGLSVILPLMKMELLKYPSLCSQYYKLIVLINDLHSNKIESLSDQMLSQLLKSVEIGLTSGFGSNIMQSCLDFVHVLAVHVYRSSHKNSKVYQPLMPFLKLVIDLILNHDITSEIMGSASVTVYALICCYSEEYKMLVQSLIQQSDSIIAERLVTEFTLLTENIPLSCERQPKLKFRDNFDRFIANVHGFLLVK